jgi:hypothetical protein
MPAQHKRDAELPGFHSLYHERFPMRNSVVARFDYAPALRAHPGVGGIAFRSSFQDAGRPFMSKKGKRPLSDRM